MKKLALGFAVSLIMGSAWIQASEEQPKPHPAVKEFVDSHQGQWNFTGRTEDTPYGPAGRWTGKMTGRPILNGQALECTYVFHSEGAAVPVLAREVLWYDSSHNALAHHFIAENGKVQQGFGMPNDPLRWEAVCSEADVSYKIRGIADTFTPDGNSFIRQAKVLVDGDRWQPLFKVKFTRIKNTNDEQTLIQLQHEWSRATVMRDVPSLGRLLADDYVLTTPDGEFLTRAQMLGQMESDDFEITSMTADNLKVQIYGSMAVVRGRARWSERSSKSVEVQFTDTWLKSKGQWQCITTHESNVTETPTYTPKPGPERKKMAIMVGDWSFAGTIDAQWQDTEFGPAGKFSGKTSSRFVLNGFFVQEHWEETYAAGGGASGTALFGYDASMDKHVSKFFLNNGNTENWTYDIVGDTMTGNSTRIGKDGETYLAKAVWQFTPKRDAFTSVWKLSADNGNTWKTWARYTGTKIGNSASNESVFTQAQEPKEVPKPGPEIQRYADAYCGQWTVSGQTFATPIEPAQQWTGNQVIARPTLDGFAVAVDHAFGPEGRLANPNLHELVWYDPVRQSLAFVSIHDNGLVLSSGTGVAGDLWRWHAIWAKGDVSYKFRVTDKHAPDGNSFIREASISADGKKWMPYFKAKFTRLNDAQATRTSDEQELLRIEREWCKALLTHDVAFLDRIWANDLICGNPEGQSRTKSTLLDHFKSGVYTVTSVTYDPIRIKVSGNSAITFGMVTEQSTFEGRDVSGKFLCTETWNRQNGQWQCVATHASKVVGKEQAIEGVWGLEDIRFDDNPIDMTTWGSLKIFQNGTFLCTGYDRQSGEVSRTHGGTYSFDGKTLTETITSVGGENMEIKVGQSFTYDIEIKDGKIHLSGQFNDQQLNEVWSHVTTRDSAPVVKVKADTSMKPITRQDFEEFCKLNKGAWSGEVPLREDLPGVGKKGDKVTAYHEYTVIEDGTALVGKFYWPDGTDTEIIAYDEANKKIAYLDISRIWGVTPATYHYSHGKWNAKGVFTSKDGISTRFNITGIFSDDDKTLTVTVVYATAGERTELVDVWHRMNQQPETNN